MTLTIGTRTNQSIRNGRIDQGADTRSRNQDLGMTKLVTASITFGGGAATGANGTFTDTFALNDPVLVQGGSLNNGAFFTVIGLDATNASFLTLDPPPKAEGPVTVVIRTP